MGNAKKRCDELQKSFEDLTKKLKEIDEKVGQLHVVRQQVWDEINIVKGRFNELKEFASVVDSNPVTGSEAGVSGKQVQVGSST